MGLPAVSVSDMLKILEKIPQWAGITKQIARISELESRVAALELALAAKPSPNLCPLCRSGQLETIAVNPDPHGGVFGIQRHTMRCNGCGHTEQRVVEPSKA